MRLIFPILMGVFGVAVLCGLGVWQMQRLAWKTDVLARIDARIGEAPVALPVAVDPVRDLYLPVSVAGALTGQEAHVLTTVPQGGPGYRIITAMQTDGGRRIMVDLGGVVQADKDLDRQVAQVAITGNLLWPDETDRWTAPPDPANIWFARDTDAMAAALGTDPVLVVARSIAGADLGTVPMPVDSASVANNHLQYAITWFSLAAVWAAMSVALIARNRKAG